VVARSAFDVKGVGCSGGVGSGLVAAASTAFERSPAGAVGEFNAPAPAPAPQLISVGVSGERARLCGSIDALSGRAKPAPEYCARTTVMLSSPPRSLARLIRSWQADLKSRAS